MGNGSGSKNLIFKENFSKNFSREIDLFDFTSFFGLDFLKFFCQSEVDKYKYKFYSLGNSFGAGPSVSDGPEDEGLVILLVNSDAS